MLRWLTRQHNDLTFMDTKIDTGPNKAGDFVETKSGTYDAAEIAVQAKVQLPGAFARGSQKNKQDLTTCHPLAEQSRRGPGESLSFI